MHFTHWPQVSKLSFCRTCIIFFPGPKCRESAESQKSSPGGKTRTCPEVSLPVPSVLLQVLTIVLSASETVGQQTSEFSHSPGPFKKRGRGWAMVVKPDGKEELLVQSVSASSHLAGLPSGSAKPASQQPPSAPGSLRAEDTQAKARQARWIPGEAGGTAPSAEDTSE